MDPRQRVSRRAVARTLDAVVVAILASLVLGSFTAKNAAGERVLDVPVAVAAMVIAGVFLYELLALRATGATLGKTVMRLRVVNAADGAPIGWQQAALRAMVAPLVITIAVATPFLRGVMPIFVVALYATALGARDRRGLVDVIAGTRVVARLP